MIAHPTIVQPDPAPLIPPAPVSGSTAGYDGAKKVIGVSS